MLYTIRLTDGDAAQLTAILNAGLETLHVYQTELGPDGKLALDRFNAQVGLNPQWHKKDDPQLRPKGE
jgi:hypothetical protein